jgi:poly-gamma-glutamate synthase PgsB/CapB
VSVPPGAPITGQIPIARRDVDEHDTLLRQVAPHEVADAKALLPQGLPAMIQRAHEHLARAEMARRAFTAVSRAMEAPGASKVAVVERYLRETAASPSQLEDDLKHLRKRPTEVFEMPALGERAAKTAMNAEIAAEVYLCVSLEITNPQTARMAPLQLLLELAQIPGRWSRRVWALRILREIVRAYQSPTPIPECLQIARNLLRRDEHRWVQPAALAFLAEVSEPEALHVAKTRLTEPGPGDDFLVRERMVTFAGRRGPAWKEIILLASKDQSEHVRLTAVRALDDFNFVAQIATDDKSHRVRAQALISLTGRWGHRAEAALARSVTQDKHAITVRTGAELLVQLAKEKKLRSRVTALESLAEAADRKELSNEGREKVADALITVDVLTDPQLHTIWQLLSQIVETVPPGGGVRVGGPAFTQVTGEGLARVLSVLSQNDYSLSADRRPDGITVYRGEPRRFASWRAWFELFHPAPSKRQAFPHTWARAPRGALRAPPNGLAEITATRVPGERVLIPTIGGWGRPLPMMDDVNSVLTPFAKPVLIVSSTGITTLTPPADPMSRIVSRMKLVFTYPKLADLRKRSLDSEEPLVQAAFVTDLRQKLGVNVEFTPLAFGPRGMRLAAPAQILPPPQQQPPMMGPPGMGHMQPGMPPQGMIAPQQGIGPGMGPNMGPGGPMGGGPGMPPPPNMVRSVLPLLAAAIPGQELLRELSAYASSMHQNRLPHVAGYASLILFGMVTRGIVIKRSIDKDRKAIPLVLGGWGTRGKSGTERIKAGMIQGLGYESLVKTTGCEAMFIHALPEIAAKEVFIYRPYDKATIWEQRGLMRLGARLGVRTFLWECMALQPDLVGLLQSQWVRDDYSTITNAYPDHEDVQGPGGFDVATCISEFVPIKGRLFTSEDQMLPIIRERARERDTKITVVEHRESDLIAEDMLARFPYHEHPRNIALVASLGRGLGISPAVAIAEMADNVVPDLGVLKTYPTVEHEGRTIDFTNGMSANERTGAWSNWVRMGFDKHDPDVDPKRYIVTVVNNRGDRVARSEVFARFLCEDAGAHRHVLIGSNVTGLYGFIKTALDKHIGTIALTKDLAGTPEERHKIARGRLSKSLRFLKIAQPTVESVMREIAAMGMPPLDPNLVGQLLQPSQPGEPVAESKRVVEQALSAQGKFVVEMVSRRRAGKALEMAVDQMLGSAPARLEQVFRDAYTVLFMDGIFPLYDYGLTGDQIIDYVAKLVPPGAHAAIMGVQNIKGTGLDFVYRWVSQDLVMKAVGKLESGTPAEKEQALRELVVHDDYGLMDAKMALARLELIKQKTGTQEYEAILGRLREIVRKRSAALTASRAATFGDKVRAFIGKTFDYMHSIRRQQQAGEVVEDLVAGRISHAAAAIRMRDVVASAKGNWMKKK